MKLDKKTIDYSYSKKSTFSFALVLLLSILMIAVGISIKTTITSAYGLATPQSPISFGSDSFNNQTLFSLPEIYQKAQKSVVMITSYTPNAIGSGSGILYDDQGHIVTNYHVVEENDNSLNDNSIDVTFFDGYVYPAKIVGTDPFNDIAVIKVDNVPKEKLIPLSFGDSSKMKPGDQVAAFGFPKSFDPSIAQSNVASMTTGIVSAIGRFMDESLVLQGEPFKIPDVIQTDAAINHGNSGGPLLNMKGEVIGINTAIIPDASLMNFAVPSNTVKKIVPWLISSGKFLHPWLGIEGIDITSGIAQIINLNEPRGFLVTDVDEESPASQAGIQGGNKTVFIARESRNIITGGDVILKLDNKDIRNLADILVYLQQEKNVGDIVNITIFRDGNYKTIPVKLEAKPIIGG